MCNHKYLQVAFFCGMNIIFRLHCIGEIATGSKNDFVCRNTYITFFGDNRVEYFRVLLHNFESGNSDQLVLTEKQFCCQFRIKLRAILALHNY